MDGAAGIIPIGFSASLVAGAATGAGALPLLFLRRGISERVEDLFLSFAAGVMLAAAFFSLILPALDAAEARGLSEPGAAATVIAALLLGVACIWLIHERMLFIVTREIIPETHRKGHENEATLGFTAVSRP
jgi:zinc transporter, ZIP family